MRHMNSVGSLLRDARQKKGILLEDVEKATRIRRKFLEAIENDDYELIPSPAYAKGFVKNYSEFLGLDSATTLAFFRRQSQDISKTSLLPKKSIAAENSLLRLTPGRFLMFLLGVCAFLFLSYFFVQYRNLQQPPVLVIEKPEQEKIVEDRKVDVLGSTEPDATVMVNGVSVLVRSDGKFFDQVSLDPGVNTITITATSRYGKSTTVVRKVGLKQ
jgi:cytoskeletal protein RodZ